MVIRKRPEDRKVTTKVFLKNVSGNIQIDKKICMECPSENVAYDIG
jgi:hypothetical protein